MDKKNVVLYHGKCQDGFASAWVASLALGVENTEFVPCFHGPDKEKDVPVILDRDVWVLDFSFERDTLLYMNQRAASLTVLDHHKSAQEALEGLSFCVFDMERSGAGLAWDWFMEGEDRPWIVDYVEDRDLWNWALPDSREINAALNTYPHDFEVWDELSRTSVSHLVAEGRVLLRSVDKYVSSMREQARKMSFGGHENIPVVNAPYINISELVGSLAEDAPFAVGWAQQADGTFVYSLRSKGDFDVSALAKKLGGGGHKASAGFVSTCLPDELSGEL